MLIFISLIISDVGHLFTCLIATYMLELPFTCFFFLPLVFWASLVAQMVKNLLAVQETQIWSLGQQDPLKKGIATHSSIFAWRILWTEEPRGLHSPWGHKELDTTGQLSFSLYLDSAHLLGHFQFPQKSGHTQGFHEFSLKKKLSKIIGWQAVS